MSNKLLKKTYITLILIIIYLPIFFVVIYSFNSSKTSSIWSGVTLKWYTEMINDRSLWEAFSASIVVAMFSAVISAVIGTLGAVSINRLNTKIKLFVNTLSYIPIIIPEIILAVALLMFFSVLPLNYGIFTLILAHSTFCIPYVFIMVQIRLSGIDYSIYEAAIDLGANKIQIFFTITLPLIIPSILSGTLLSIAMSLDDVIISIFLSGPKSTTLPVKIFSMLKLGITPKINALCTFMLLITFIILGIVAFFYKNNIERKEKIF